MIITNHNKNNFYTLEDGTVIRGTIQITNDENEAITSFLCSRKAKAIKECDTYVRDSIGGVKFSKNKM